MLLRSSRVAAHLTKEALVGRLAVSAGKGVLNQAGKHWKGLLGAGMVASTAAPEIQKGMQQSKVGLTQPWLQASNSGQVPTVPKF